VNHRRGFGSDDYNPCNWPRVVGMLRAGRTVILRAWTPDLSAPTSSYPNPVYARSLPCVACRRALCIGARNGLAFRGTSSVR